MRAENRILTGAGLALVATTMFFGLWYAIFDEHQTLMGMGMSLATAFVEAASGNLAQAHAAIDQYAATAAEYRLEVHFHGHLGFLGLVLILMGLVAHALGFGERNRRRLAVVLALGALLFPVGVILQIGPLAPAGSAIAAAGAAGLTIGVFAFFVGMLRIGRRHA